MEWLPLDKLTCLVLSLMDNFTINYKIIFFIFLTYSVVARKGSSASQSSRGEACESNFDFLNILTIKVKIWTVEDTILDSMQNLLTYFLTAHTCKSSNNHVHLNINNFLSFH